jgi:hypothetical protein
MKHTCKSTHLKSNRTDNHLSENSGYRVSPFFSSTPLCISLSPRSYESFISPSLLLYISTTRIFILIDHKLTWTLSPPTSRVVIRPPGRKCAAKWGPALAGIANPTPAARRWQRGPQHPNSCKVVDGARKEGMRENRGTGIFTLGVSS